MSDELFPTFLKLTNRPVLVVGGGSVAASKLAALLAAGARVTVVAPEVVDEIASRPVRVERRPFQASDLDDVWFVVAAAPPDVNRIVSAAAEARRLFVNAVDDPAHATAYLGGVVRKNGVTLAVSTDGRAPAVAGLLREGLNEVIPDDVGQWLRVSDALRAEWRQAAVPMERRRPLLLDAINRLYEQREPVDTGGQP
jgi:uroporphyrin-III C-methyltransferase / precorrin-2 dehydrogenase / sirohydrochlorin ferrochelatase